MAISVYSCLRPPPPSPPPPPPPKLTNLTKTSSGTVAPWSERKEVSWRSRCVSTVACVIIGSTVAFGGGGDGEVLAGDLRAVEGPQVRKVMRWSDRRRCPPWHANSLENIVPENLPRPSAGGGRSNRLAAYGHQMSAAPPVGSSIHYRSSSSSSCYYL